MNFRHEWKHEINYSDMLILRKRLGVIAAADRHAKGGVYQVRSLYFDTPSDSALREKLDGTDPREKFRIRYYNGDASLIHLEKKCKTGNLSSKYAASLTAAQAQDIVCGNLDWMMACDAPLIRELYAKMRGKLLRPRTIVDYTREPFVYAPGNVRVTLDYNIRTGLNCTDFLDPDCVTIPAGDAPVILEVKWDGFLPDSIRNAVQLNGRHAAAFSKYAQCRIYG